MFSFAIEPVFPMFHSIAARFADMRMHEKGCQGHLEFHPATGNAGTGRASKVQSEHGCEFAPVAG
ncbi:MAG TPA: hypothetical protein DHV88_12385 [Roseburia sp.]|nr:hypothetical protein [Roseburia sp.]